MKRLTLALAISLLTTTVLIPQAVAGKRTSSYERAIKGTYPHDNPLAPGIGVLGSGGPSFLRASSQGIELGPLEKYVKVVVRDDSGVPVYASIDRGKAPPGWDAPNDVVPPYQNSDRITYFCDRTPGAVRIPPDGLTVFGRDVLWLTIYEDPCPQDMTKLKTSLASGTFTVTLMDRPPGK